MPRISEETINELRPHARDYLQQFMGRDPRKKFRCVNPQHDDKRPSGFYGEQEHIVGCSSCGCKFTLFGLLELNEGIHGFPQQVKRAAELYGVEVKYDDSSPAGKPGKRANAATAATGDHGTREEEPDYTAFFAEAHANLPATDYPQQRGLSPAICERFNLGYVAEWKHPKAPPTAPTTPRLIVPTGRSSYLARDTRPDASPQYRKQKCGPVHIFDLDAILQAERPTFIVEGELDAISIAEAGGQAIGLGSASYVGLFFKQLDALLADTGAEVTQPVIISLDRDKAGADATTQLVEGLRQRHIHSCVRQVAGDYKDGNERLVHDREGLVAAVKAAEAEALASAQEAQNADAAAEQAERDAFLRSISIDLPAFERAIADSAQTPAMSTGFEKLDAALGGGLYPGLVVLGAVTSSGKTAFTEQIGDAVAQAGGSTLYFSLEMSRDELIARSVSRHTLLRALAHGIDTLSCKTARGVTDGRRWSNYSATERQLIYDSIDDFAEYADRVKIIEGMGNVGMAEVRQTVERFIDYTGQRPLCIVDYVQLLQSADPRLSDKQAVDRNVYQLKQLSRDFRLPVIAVSSLNRQGYREPVLMESFKESGSIEYGSDILMGYQFAGVGTDGFDLPSAKAANPRQMELVILKNRSYGIPASPCRFRYYSQFNAFFEA